LVAIEAGHDSRLKGEIPMENSTKDKVEGSFHELKGKIKENVGQVTNNPDLESEGKGEKVVGKFQKKVAEAEKVFEK
jgi:uncharacterized protein YjbJ (UPF0337 family)